MDQGHGKKEKLYVKSFSISGSNQRLSQHWGNEYIGDYLFSLGSVSAGGGVLYKVLRAETKYSCLATHLLQTTTTTKNRDKRRNSKIDTCAPTADSLWKGKSFNNKSKLKKVLNSSSGNLRGTFTFP